MDRLDVIATFVAVVDGKSFAAAARKLARSPAAVTRAIAALEARLGTRLLNRTTRSVSLTDVGRQYYAGARRLLDDYQQTELIAAGTLAAPKGVLQITAPTVFGRLHVLPVATDFLTAHPQVDIRLLLTDRVISLVEEGIDLAVRIGELPDSSLVARRVGEVRSVVCASRHYLKRRGTPQRPADLARHDAVIFSGLPSGDRWVFRRKRREIAVTVRPRLVINGAEAAMDAAAAGLGVARVLSYQLHPRIAAGTLVPILEAWDDRIEPIHLVVPAGRHMAAKVRAFIDLAAKVLPSRL
ncbi:MAG: LysR family transcriptional regulator [Xanthobacteraceae bacterium]